MSQSVQDFYNGNPEREWDRLERPFFSIEFASGLYLIEKYFPKHGHICDVGGGPGRYAIELLKRGYQVTLFDLSKELLEIAEAQIEKLSLQAEQVIQGDARDLSGLASEHYEGVLCMGPMYHIIKPQDRAKALAELRRILKPEGTALITYLNTWGLIGAGIAHFPDWYRDIARLRSMINERIVEAKEVSNFTECYWSTPEVALKEVEQAGFEIVSYAAAQGFAGGKGILLEQLAAENPEAYTNVVQVAAEMCELKQYRDIGEHLHIVVHKPGSK